MDFDPEKKRHKDTDARWTKKRGGTFFGYKNHAKVCVALTIFLGGYIQLNINVFHPPPSPKK